MIGEATIAQPFRDFGIHGKPVGLAVWAKVTTNLGPFVPIQTQPAQRIQQRVV
ncbi:unannotated protein [freshwater metagenome]|uniref:Unannotated protein n=1 Tax=freshwater metagenome TaxID=449393 RepID=A0A6J6N8L1_9ZZZZ